MSEFKKIFECSDLDSLKEKLEQDFDENARYPVRFIFLNSYHELNEIVKFLSAKLDNFDISSLLQPYGNEDGWFLDTTLINKIENIQNISVVYPVSEYFRFLDRDTLLYSVFPALSQIENNESKWKFKIYIPLVGLWDQFKLFWREYYKNKEDYVHWKLNAVEELNLNLYQICFDFESINSNFKHVKNSKEWLELWKEPNIQKVISSSERLSRNIENCFSYNVVIPEIINNPKDYLSKILFFDVNFEYDDSEIDFWKEFLIELNENSYSSFDNFCSIKFNINDIENSSLTEFLDKYLRTSRDYEKWILKNLFMSSIKFNNSYLKHCLNSIRTFDNSYLARKVYLNIFELENSTMYLEERRILLKKLHKFSLTFPEYEFEEYFEKINDLPINLQFKYLTMYTDTEKHKILEFIKLLDFNFIFVDLKAIFPDLYYYLDWNLTFDHSIPEWIVEYFKEYNKSKVLNLKSEKLDYLLNEKNSSSDNFYEWYLPFLNNNVESSQHHMIWVDALGVEWLPLLNYYLNKFCKINSKKIKYKTINSVELPSATEFNRYDCEKIEKLDNYIHNNHYSYPMSLLEEIEIIKSIAFEISTKSYRKISIVSDHGFSFLCTKDFGLNKDYKFEDSEHEGRYVQLNSDMAISGAGEDYIVHGISEKYIIASKHTTLNKFPSHEVHGGATPEEVLVPYIIIEPDNNVEIEYNILPLVNEINVTFDKELPIDIRPKPELSAIAICNNEKYELFEKDNKYFIQLDSNIKKGNQLFIIKIDDVEVSEFEVKINKGGMMEEDYDGLFG